MFTRGWRCNAHGNVAPSSSQPPDKSQPSSSSEANSDSPSARGYFEYFSKALRAGCAAVGTFRVSCVQRPWAKKSRSAWPVFAPACEKQSVSRVDGVLRNFDCYAVTRE